MQYVKSHLTLVGTDISALLVGTDISNFKLTAGAVVAEVRRGCGEVTSGVRFCRGQRLLSLQNAVKMSVTGAGTFELILKVHAVPVLTTGARIGARETTTACRHWQHKTSIPGGIDRN